MTFTKGAVYFLLLGSAAGALSSCETDTRDVRVVHHYYDDSRPESAYYPAYRTEPAYYSTSRSYESTHEAQDFDVVNQYDRQSR